MNNKLLCIALGILLVIGVVFRSHELYRWPREGATFDEFAWTFQGLSLLTKGIPTSWSPHAAYKNRMMYKNPQGTMFILVTPYLEHPPLFGLVAGSFAYIRGVRTFDDVTLEKIRPLALIIGTIAVVAVYLFTAGIYGNGIGLLAAGIYTITPTIAVGSRLVQNENFFIPLLLFTLYFIHRYIKENTASISSGNLVMAACISALAPLAKVPWMAAPLAAISILFYFKKWKAGILIACAVSMCFLGFFLYGYALDREVFLNLWKLQLARYDLTFDSLFVLFRDPIIVDRLFVDGWIYFGWAAMLYLFADVNKKNIFVITGFLAYCAIFVFAIPSEPQHGWYRFPFYPFLTVATALFLRNMFNKNYFSTALFFIITGSALLGTSWARLYGFSYPLFRTFLVTVAFGALPALFPVLSKNRLFRYVNWCLLGIIILLSLWSIFLYNEQ